MTHEASGTDQEQRGGADSESAVGNRDSAGESVEAPEADRADGQESLDERPDHVDQNALWLDVGDSEELDIDRISAGFNAGVDVLLATPEQFTDVKLPQGTRRAVHYADLDGDDVENYDVVIVDDRDMSTDLAEQEVEVALRTRVEDQNTMEEALTAFSGEVEYGLVELEDDTNIPLELLIAECQDDETSLLKVVESTEEAEVAFGVLEGGTDGVLLRSGDIGTISEVAKRVESQAQTEFELQELTVTNVEHIGMGSRNCVDTTTLLTTEEGMVVGSQSNGGVLVCSETHPLPYMDLRPFRVNAGAVHSYVWAPDGRTRYLSELEVGDEVLAVGFDGTARPVRVGRSKIEERPLLLIECECGDESVNIILQDDWHVRVMGPDGEPVNITDLDAGDTVLGHLSDPGRHVGVKVEETILEK